MGWVGSLTVALASRVQWQFDICDMLLNFQWVDILFHWLRDFQELLVECSTNRVTAAGQPFISKLIRILLKFQNSALNRILRSRLNSFFVWLLFQFFITNPNIAICVKNVNTPCLYSLYNLSLLHPLTHNAWTACGILMPKMFFFLLYQNAPAYSILSVSVRKAEY